MKIVSLAAIVAATSTVVCGELPLCGLNDVESIMGALSKCDILARLVTSSSTPSDADIAKLCQIDDCKTAFKLFVQLPCRFKDESARKKYNCDKPPSSSSAIAHTSIATAAALVSIAALVFQLA
ncbi:hypothetical protein Ae201684P_003480 [Aphanomyces euteiches]|uniref:Elicitin-like protein n=1 Tax=Aphanomyces euteiches TaxID=100861 RepID=A0A6G0WNT3_9STRA|nr:hypothetical protein Ae201684_013333 [Aphanomyces euteiches]KAH9064693.1 hypothetical protein Ae201684P_003480 [Aphanomyces euteiches]